MPALRILVLLVFIAAQAPELVSRDLRSHVLPLYFARPISRIDYPLAKLAAFFLACLVMIEVPLLLLYLGTVTQVHGGSADLGADPGADPRPAARAWPGRRCWRASACCSPRSAGGARSRPAAVAIFFLLT